jgi:hypothetical protein
MKPRVASPKVNTTPVLRNRGAGELVDGLHETALTCAAFDSRRLHQLTNYYLTKAPWSDRSPKVCATKRSFVRLQAPLFWWRLPTRGRKTG